MMNNNQMPMNQMANFMNQMNANNNPNPNQQIPSDNDFISVVFRLGSTNGNNSNQIVEQKDGPTITIQCKANDKVEEIIKKYRQKTGFKDKARFFFNAKNLCPTLTVAEAGITNNSHIFVVSIENLYGGY